ASVKVDVAILDERGAPVSASGRGSGFSSTGQGHADYTIANPTGKVYAVLKLPSTVTTSESIPFRFDNESLDQTAP
nr:hypothetical protein [Gemmatimonadaceae bacterium]